jgi:tetratricopeptide (TPR) repeat protein
MSPHPPTRHRAIVAALLAALTLAALAPVLHNDFISYDDEQYVTRNYHVRPGLTAGGVRWALTTDYAANWHPLTWISHMLDVQLFGKNAHGHHLTSLLFHLASTVMLFLVLTTMTGATGRSAFVAALFGVHPLHVESVAWIAERKDVLSTFFFMLTLGAYVRYVAAPSTRRYALVMLAFAAGLMAKPMLVTLPFVLILLDYWPLSRWPERSFRRLLLEKLPLVPFVIASSIATFVAQSRGGAVNSLEIFPLGVRVGNAIVAYGVYLWKTIWPVDLAFFYLHPAAARPPWQVGVAAAALIAATAIAFRERRRRPYAIVGWLWYVGTLVPVIGLIQVGAQSHADRYTYIPLIGVFIVIAWGAHSALSSIVSTRSLYALGATSLAVLAMLSHAQAGRWRDSMTLYEHDLRVVGDNPLVENLIGVTLADQGRHADAIPRFERALRLSPSYVRAYDNLGLALIKTGRAADAVHPLEAAIRIDPGAPEPRNTLGVALSRTNRTREAIEQFETALRLRPDNPAALTNFGSVLVGTGSIEEGRGMYEKALRLDPTYAEAHTKLGLSLAQQGRLQDALAELNIAVALDPGYAEARQNLAMGLYLTGDTEKAREQVEAARRLGLTPQESLLKLLAPATSDSP